MVPIGMVVVPAAVVTVPVGTETLPTGMLTVPDRDALLALLLGEEIMVVPLSGAGDTARNGVTVPVGFAGEGTDIVPRGPGAAIVAFPITPGEGM